MAETVDLPAALADAVAVARPRFGRHVGTIHYVESLPSTMDTAASRAEAGGEHGLVIIAGHQTAGRGRRGHTWSSPVGAGLYFSTLVRPPLAPYVEGAPSLLGLLTLTAGLAVAEGVGNATGLETSLKWPNDLFCSYKIAGVLAEGHRIGSPDQHVVVGVGINLRDVPYVSERERATSIERELGRAPDAWLVLAEVLAAWAGRYQDLLDGRFGQIVDRWRSRAAGVSGRPVVWVDASGEHEGTTTGVDETGALLVDTRGEIVRITSGSVQWR